MKPIYVAGPVIRRWQSHPEVHAIYATLEREAESLGIPLHLPYSESELESMSPKEFVTEITNRLSNFEAVIAVYHDRDPSTASESAIAALSGKRLLIVTDDTGLVPRLLRGLPGTMDVVSAGDLSALRRALTTLAEGDPALGPAREPVLA